MVFTEEDKAVIEILYLIIGYGLWKLMREFPEKGGRKGLDWIIL